MPSLRSEREWIQLGPAETFQLQCWSFSLLVLLYLKILFEAYDFMCAHILADVQDVPLNHLVKSANISAKV